MCQPVMIDCEYWLRTHFENIVLERWSLVKEMSS